MDIGSMNNEYTQAYDAWYRPHMFKGPLLVCKKKSGKEKKKEKETPPLYRYTLL